MSIYLKPEKVQEALEAGAELRDVTRVTLGFPAFDTLHYDPTVSLEPAADLGYTTEEAEAEAPPVRNGASRLALRAALGGAALLAAALA